MTMVIPQQRQAMTPMKTPYDTNHQWTIRAGRSISQKRIYSLMVALLLSAAPAVAQGTLAPVPMQQLFTNSGIPAAGYWLCTYEAGSTTAATVYSNVGLTTAFSNPIVLSSAGRPQTSSVELPMFLSPGRSYKFVFKSPTTPVNCTTGTTIWSVDNVGAIPASSAALDVTGTAGESIAAGDVVYMATGAGSTNAGQWYKTDADSTVTSTSVLQIGVAPSAIVSGATGSIRLSGAVTVTGPLSPGSAYFASATAGGLTPTPPTNAIRVGEAESATSLMIGLTRVPVSPRASPCSRLTLTTGTPVTTSDVTAATTLFYTPYGCNQIDLYNGTSWTPYTIAQLSIAVPATTVQMYDVFVYDNSGTVALELTAWTNDTTRATALVFQDGVYVKTGVTTRRYVGSFRTASVSGQTEDSETKRYVWNYYNRVVRKLKKLDTTASWTWATGSWRQARAQAANQLDFVIGVSEDAVEAELNTIASIGTGLNGFGVGIGLDSTSAVSADSTGQDVAPGDANERVSVPATYHGYPGIGRHVLTWLEFGNAATVTFNGTGPSATGTQSGITGWVRG